MKPIPKSLHTVTVLRRVAAAQVSPCVSVDQALVIALDILCLEDLVDTYGLVQQAKAQIIRAAGGAA